jgi:ribosome-binding factor A
MSRRTERVADALLEALSELLLREVKDPRVERVTLTRVDVSGDLRQAKVGYCTLGDDAARERALKGLESAAGFLQGKVARMLHMRYAPQIHFRYDDAFEKADEVDRLLKRARSGEQSD